MGERHNGKLMKKLTMVLVLVVVAIGAFMFSEASVKAAEDDVVYIPDAELKAVLNETLGVENLEADITEGQLASIKKINTGIRREITDITGIQYCTNLEELWIYFDSENTCDVSLIGELSNLKKLTLQMWRVKNVKDVLNCTELEYLSLFSGIGFSSVKLDSERFSELKQLKHLALTNFAIDDYSCLGELTNLEYLYMWGVSGMTELPDLSTCTKITTLRIEGCQDLVDVSGIKGLKNLTELRIEWCGKFEDITPIKNLKKLATLDLRSTNVSDLSPIYGLTSLKNLDLESVTGITSYAPLRGLSNLECLIMNNNKITEENEKTYVGAISLLKSLKELYLYDCGISDEHTSMFESLINLQKLDLTRNNIADASFLYNLRENLVDVNLDKNKIGDNEIYKYLTKLTDFGIEGSYITDFSFVSSMPYLSDCSDYNYRATTYSEDNIKVFADDTECIVKNNIKDDKGNLLAPVESECYTYNEQNGEITVFLDKLTEDFKGISYRLDVKDENRTLYLAHLKTITTTVVEPAELKVELKAQGAAESERNKTYEAVIGDNVILNATGKGGYGRYEYQFLVKYPADTDWTVIKEYSTDSSHTIQLNEKKFGDYRVDVKDCRGQVASSEAISIVERDYLFYADGSITELTTDVGETIELKIRGFEGDRYDFILTAENATTGTRENLVITSECRTVNYTVKETGDILFKLHIQDTDNMYMYMSNITLHAVEPIVADFETNGKTEEITVTNIQNVKLKAEVSNVIGSYKYTITAYDADAKTSKILVKGVSDAESITYIWTSGDAGNVILYFMVTDEVGREAVREVKVNVVNKSGLCKDIEGKWYYFTNGKIDISVTGLAKNSKGWWYVKDGALDFAYTGLAKNSYGWWYVKNGKVDFDYTGMAKNSKGWWYIKNGKLDFGYTGMATNAHGTWYMKSGKLDTSVSGLVKTNIGWVYLTNGKLDTTVTSLVKNSKGWWYVKEGKLDLTYTGLATNKYGTWYVTKGKLDTTVNGMIKVDSTWVYMVNGKLDTSYTGMAKNKYGWWQMTNGKLDLTYTGISTNQYGMWYMTNGKLDLTYTGKATYNGVTYNVVKGQVVK